MRKQKVGEMIYEDLSYELCHITLEVSEYQLNSWQEHMHLYCYVVSWKLERCKLCNHWEPQGH